MISQARYLQLCNLINHTRTLWNTGKEDIKLSDKEYDEFMSEIYEYETIHKPAENSPTISVNPTTVNTVKHPITMLTYNKTHDLKAISAFFRDKHCPEVQVEPVIDGADIQLIYKAGRLVSVITFGDGKYGLECVQTAQYVTDIPKQLNIIDTENEELIVSGVVYLTKDNHNRYCTEYGIQLNSRNLAGGLIKRRYEPHRAKYLSFKAYSLDNALQLVYNTQDDIKQEHVISQTAARQFLINRGIPVVESWLSNRWCDIYDYLTDREKTRKDNEYPVIGQLLKLEDLTDHLKLTKDDLLAEYGMIYKYSPDEVDTELIAIEWQVGSSGKITPIAVVHSVDAGGTSISSVNIHSINKIAELDLQLHDILTICKTKDVMSVSVKQNKHTEDSSVITIPTHCPICGSELVNNCCVSLQCDARLIARLQVWCSQYVAHFKGVNKVTISYLYEKGVVKYPTDFYTNTEKIKQTLLETQIKSTQLQALMASIKRTRDTLTFEELVRGLCLENIADSGTRKINRYFEKDVHVIGRSSKLQAFLNLDMGTLQLLLGESKGAECWNQLHNSVPENFYVNMIHKMINVFT